MRVEKGQLDQSGYDVVDPLSLRVDAVKRGVGRPKHDANLNGRKQIVSRTKEFMIINPFHNVQRKDIAEFVGVTPALVSYYYPEKYDLILEASSAPVVSYALNVTSILRNNKPILERTRELIFEFVDINLSTGYTIDYYIYAIQRRNRENELSLMAEQYTEILGFMEKLLLFCNKPRTQASFLQSSIWGQCMYLARQPHLQTLVRESGRAKVSTDLTESIFNLLVSGLCRYQPGVTLNQT